MTSNFVEIVPPSRRQENRPAAKKTVSPLQPSDGIILVIGPRLEGHSVIFLAIQTHLSCRFLLAVDFLGLRRGGSSPQIINQAQDFPEQFPRHRHLGQLERDGPAMADHLCPGRPRNRDRRDQRGLRRPRSPSPGPSHGARPGRLGAMAPPRTPGRPRPGRRGRGPEDRVSPGRRLLKTSHRAGAPGSLSGQSRMRPIRKNGRIVAMPTRWLSAQTVTQPNSAGPIHAVALPESA